MKLWRKGTKLFHNNLLCLDTIAIDEAEDIHAGGHAVGGDGVRALVADKHATHQVNELLHDALCQRTTAACGMPEPSRKSLPENSALKDPSSGPLSSRTVVMLWHVANASTLSTSSIFLQGEIPSHL